ncbi:cAMP-dependent protein kinase type 1 [Zancudomyces culisetae]|uniref:cAMP-dependent protein kinase n=1 Tax=Zancudomyces culisetae TaxID=1213189 RepID=A0A1R1PU51_ZANCU|nr:cAMP-dependent protein kinase type 1 [Zancudomyces culisetae]|eukprot:OMH84477.1 cAMP-dependent protein kinase type 1 [Zancudomyces culisetae]
MDIDVDHGTVGTVGTVGTTLGQSKVDMCENGKDVRSDSGKTLHEKGNGNTSYTKENYAGINDEKYRKELSRKVSQEFFESARCNSKKELISDYVFFRTVGTGSFGRVRLVKKKNTNKFCAVKIMCKKDIVDSKQVEHVNNERAVLSFCDSPFLKFPSPVAKFYAAEVVSAFKYLHSFDLVYRDLKPENILVDSTGHIKITDMGFAKYVPDVTWTLCGTPDYLAPEIIQAKGYGKSVDWYSLGVLIFEMMTGYPPFYERDKYKLYERILAGRIRWPETFDPLAKDLVSRLATPDLSIRYGNLSNGVNDILNHPWFSEVDWVKLEERRIAPPLIPQSKKEGDTSNFDKYPEPFEVYGEMSAPDIYKSKFLKF